MISRPDGVDVASAEWDGQPFTAQSRSGASMVLARRLVAAGCPDQPWECRNREGQRTVYGASLHRLAGLMVRDLRIVPYVPTDRVTATVDGAEPLVGSAAPPAARRPVAAWGGP